MLRLALALLLFPVFAHAAPLDDAVSSVPEIGAPAGACFASIPPTSPEELDERDTPCSYTACPYVWVGALDPSHVAPITYAFERTCPAWVSTVPRYTEGGGASHVFGPAWAYYDRALPHPNLTPWRALAVTPEAVPVVPPILPPPVIVEGPSGCHARLIPIRPVQGYRAAYVVAFVCP